MSISINETILARAVERKIRPILIRDGALTDPDGEGYHHAKVIPKARPFLSRERLKADPVEAFKGAINASSNLLHSSEKIRPKQFLSTPAGANAGPKLVELLYGTDELMKRIQSFLEWGGYRKKRDGTTIGFNATIVSYLLAMSDPVRYAFCKPEVYSAAAAALLREGEVTEDSAERVSHCTDFYTAALRLFRDKHGLPFTDLMHVHIAFYVVEKYEADWPTWDDLVGEDDGNKDDEEPVPPPDPKPLPQMMQPLNLILYGPPGTGKTYHSIRRAVEICDGRLPLGPPDATQARFRQLRDERRIELVTFHQSYGYEEFVEGIRPVLTTSGQEGTPAESGDVRYVCRPGVFKAVCSMARVSGTTASQATQVDLSKQKIWKMSLGNKLKPEEAEVYDECIDAKQVRIGYGLGLDFTGCDDREAVAAKLKAADPAVTDFHVDVVDRFKNRMKVGDFVVVTDGTLAFRAIGRVKGEYEKLDLGIYPQMRPVEWLLRAPESVPAERIYKKDFQQQTIYQLKEHLVRVDALRDMLSGKPRPPENFVLIIDEINRGNISKIFGELITLVEPDKRIGGTTEMTVKLPYSGEEFGVPMNLHLVGTMNTADRSIAFLDTALRRRFRFEEMMPEPETIRAKVGKAGIVEGVDVAGLLEQINRRIEILFDREHQIGHAYLLGVRSPADLRDSFRHQIIPLLQEYFYGDWEKVCRVLGCPYDVLSGKPTTKNPLPLIRVTALSGTDLPGTSADDVEARFQHQLNPDVFDKAAADLRLCFKWVFGEAANGKPAAGASAAEPEKEI